MIIPVDTDVLNKYQLTADSYIHLYYCYHKLPHLMGPAIVTLLQRKDLIDSHGEVTELGRTLFESPKIGFDQMPLEEFCTYLNDLFPKGIKTGGKPVRSAIGIPVVKKLKQFEKDYKYSRETIVKATKAYVLDRKKSNYSYMKVFSYFINKVGEDSTLAAWCEQILDANTNTNISDAEGRITKTL